MSRKSAISLVPRAPKAKLTAEQERFRYLIAQIQTARTAHATWERTAGKFRAEHTQRLQPLRASLRELSRGTVVEIDRLLGESGWSRVDRVALRQILWVTADALLAANPDDLELRELFEKHGERDFDAVKQEEMQRLREEAEELTGLDLGDDDDIRTEEELVQRMYERMAEREAAEEERESARARERRHTAEEKRKEAAAQLVRQSLREIYRKLASAVHPDREADAKKREEKNALMQRINQAYAANDLMALFELQIETGLAGADEIGKASPQRLKQYNKLLVQQLEEAKKALREQQSAFRMDFGLDPGSALDPQRLNLATQRMGRAIRQEIARQKEFLSLLKNRAATKRWLKEQRGV